MARKKITYRPSKGSSVSAGISIEEILEFYQSRRVTSLKSMAV